MPEEILEQNNQLLDEPEMQAMVTAGVFVGRIKMKTHPRMRPNILATRNNIEIINLGKTLEKLDEAMEFVKARVIAKANILLVGTQPAAEEGLLRLSKEFNLPAVTIRWLGGTMTNYRVISKRIEYFKKLKMDDKNGAFLKYTKKEQLGIKKELEKLEQLMSGLESMTSRPDLLILIDPVAHRPAALEARKLGVPIVAYSNTDTDPNNIEYLIPGNTKARTSVNWFLEKLGDTIRAGRKEAEKELIAAVAEKPKQ
jgi:small subunit ribosomal protein S2